MLSKPENLPIISESPPMSSCSLALAGVSGDVIWLCDHSHRAAAAANALSDQADTGKVQEWLGHANVSPL